MKSKRRSKSSPLLLLVVVLFLALGAVIWYGWSLYTKAEAIVDRSFETFRSGDEDRTSDTIKRPFAVAFIGIDDSDARNQGEYDSLADALLVATFNPNEHSVRLVSIPRDTYAYFPSNGSYDKATHAHRIGGSTTTVEMLEYLLNLRIDYFVKADFNGFIQLIDALGGIEVDVPYEFVEKDENDRNVIHLQRGKQTVDGRHALALARTRKLDNDFERGKRQQMIIRSIIHRAVEPSAVATYPQLLESLDGHIKTNFRFKQLLSLSTYAKNGLPEVETLSLTGRDFQKGGLYYFKPSERSLTDVRTALKEHMKS